MIATELTYVQRRSAPLEGHPVATEPPRVPVRISIKLGVLVCVWLQLLYLSYVLQMDSFIPKALKIILLEAFLQIAFDFRNPGFQLRHDSLSLGRITDALHSLPKFEYLHLRG